MVNSKLLKIRSFVLERWSIFFLLLLLIFFSITARGFLSIQNLQDILIASISVLILGIGVTFVIISGGIDLSVGYSMSLSAVIIAWFIRALTQNNTHPALSILTGLVVSFFVIMIVGLTNGYLIAYLQVPPFIATLGMLGITHGVALIVSRGFPIANLPQIISSLGNRYLFYFIPGKWFSFFILPENIPIEESRNVVRIIPLVVIVVAIIAIVMIIILSKTPFGKHTYAIGCSLEVAKQAGIKTKVHLLKVYSISALFTLFAGLIYVFRFGSGNVEAGSAHLLNSIAAVVIGGASLYGGTGSIKGTIIGALIIGTLTVGLVMLGVKPFYQYIVIGGVIIIGVLIDRFK
jgi:ribose/xylose/arabinose/galactoside ABC-type transport system permease subunit